MGKAGPGEERGMKGGRRRGDKHVPSKDTANRVVGTRDPKDKWGMSVRGGCRPFQPQWGAVTAGTQTWPGGPEWPGRVESQRCRWGWQRNRPDFPGMPQLGSEPC